MSLKRIPQYLPFREQSSFFLNLQHYSTDLDVYQQLIYDSLLSIHIDHLLQSFECLSSNQSKIAMRRSKATLTAQPTRAELAQRHSAMSLFTC